MLADGGAVDVKVDDWWDGEASLLHVAAGHDSVSVLEEYCTHRYPGPDRIYEIDLSTLTARRLREFGPS